MTKTSIVTSEEKLCKECSDREVAEKKDEDPRKEEVFLSEFTQATMGTSFEIPNRIQVTQNSSNHNKNVQPVAEYLPAFRSFVSVISKSGLRIRLNLLNLVVPQRLLQPTEDAMMHLRVLLSDMGFEVFDRATLAFFTIGSELDVRKAAWRFFNLYKLTKTAEFKSPNREILKSMEAEGFIEGFAFHKDGTYGVLLRAEKFCIHNHAVMYIAREFICYILSFVNLGLLRAGFIEVGNARNWN